ncbi:MAG: hypothetical protein M3139_04685 [Bacteroidota bacterium]|nr:hypothetical protein [Bacteroidota bacterium]
MKKKTLALVILNSITLVIMLLANFAGATGFFTKENVGDISHKYDTLFAPAGYTFIIWSVIFLLAICFAIYQWVLLKNDDPKNYISRTGIWFIVSNVANASWLYCWLNEQLGLSVICIVILLISLINLAINLRLELDDVPVREIFFVWWPITFYLGWIMVATIACIAAWLTSIGWMRFGISENIWAIALIIIACFIYILLIMKRNMREASSVGVWAFIGIAVRQWYYFKDISWVAIIACLILTVASLIHVYKNKYYNIPLKLKRGEW